MISILKIVTCECKIEMLR